VLAAYIYIIVGYSRPMGSIPTSGEVCCPVRWSALCFLLFFESQTPPLRFATETGSAGSREGPHLSERAPHSLFPNRAHNPARQEIKRGLGNRRSDARETSRAARAARRRIAARKGRRCVAARTLGRSQAWPLGCPGTRRGAWTVGQTSPRALDDAIEGPSPQHQGEVQRRYRRVASAKKTPTVGVP
jgi:hypothetical protein